VQRLLIGRSKPALDGPTALAHVSRPAAADDNATAASQCQSSAELALRPCRFASNRAVILGTTCVKRIAVEM